MDYINSNCAYIYIYIRNKEGFSVNDCIRNCPGAKDPASCVQTCKDQYKHLSTSEIERCDYVNCCILSDPRNPNSRCMPGTTVLRNSTVCDSSKGEIKLKSYKSSCDGGITPCSDYNNDLSRSDIDRECIRHIWNNVAKCPNNNADDIIAYYEQTTKPNGTVPNITINGYSVAAASRTLGSIINDAKLWASLPSAQHRTKCYGSDTSKWPRV